MYNAAHCNTGVSMITRNSTKTARTLAYTLVIAFLPAAATAHAAPAPGDAAFDALVDEFYRDYAAERPVEATDRGLHDHDGDLDDYSAAGVAKHAARLHRFAER